MSLKETIRKQSNAKTVQNRTNRVNNKNKKYNKSMSKSDKAYIQGDLKKSASMKAYGVQKSLAKGEKVYGYDDDDIFTGGRKASNYKALKRGEKDVYKTKYIQTNKTRNNPTLITPKNGGKPFYSTSRMLTNKEQRNYEKYGTLAKPDSELEKKVKKVASGVGKVVLGGLDIAGTPGYLITGATKGMVDGFNGNGKLDKGELKNAIKGAKDNISLTWKNKANYKGEGKFGFGDVFDSVDALEERKKKNDPNYESKQIYRASTGNGFDRDKLSDKTKKTLNTIGGMGLDVALPMEFNLPLGTLLRGTGKSFTNVAKKFDAKDIGKVVDTVLDGQKIDDIAKEVMTHKAMNKVNKLAGNIDKNSMEGVKLLGKELLSGEQVAKIGDATGISRAYNQVRHFMQQGQRSKNVEDVVAKVINKQTNGRYKLVDPLVKTSMKMDKEQYDLAMGFRPDWKLRKEAKNLDEGFKNKTYERELSDYEKLTNEIQSWIKETERREKSGFKNITNARPKEKPNFDDIEFNDTPVSPTKSFDEEIRELIGLDDNVELNTINNSDMSQLDNIPFDVIQAKRQPRNRRIGNAPEGTMFPYIDEGKYNYNADELDAEILNERAYNKISDSNRRNKINETNEKLKESNEIAQAFMEKFGAKSVKTNVNNIDEGVEALLNIFDKPKTKTKLKTLSQRREAFNSMFDYVDINNLTEEQSDIIKSIKHIGNKVNSKDKDALIANINNIFFGGQGVVPENVSASKLKKISKFFDDVANPLNKTQFNKEGASLLRADLTDPIFEKKQDLLKSQFGTKGSLQDAIKKTHFKAEEARRKGLVDEYRSLTNKVDELSQKLIDRENLWTEIREMESEDFFAKYPNMASKYFESPINEHSLKQNYKDVVEEYANTHNDLKNVTKDELVDEYYNKARAEVMEELHNNFDKYRGTFENRRDVDAFIQKETMHRAEFYANNEMNFVNKENKVEEIMNRKRNRETVEGNVRDNQIKELNQNVKNYRKKLDLKYVDTNKSNVQDYNVKTIKQNIVKIIKSKWDDSLDERALSELYGQQIRMLDKLGVPRESYMPKLKEYETKMEAYNTAKREYIKSQKYKSQNTNPINELENKLKIKKEQRDNLLERVANQEGFTFKKKKLNNEKQKYLDKDEIDFDKYFMAQSGDNMGKIEDDFISGVGEEIGEYDRNAIFGEIENRNTSDIINKNEKRDFDFSPIRNIIKINSDNSVSRVKSPFEQKYRIDSNNLPPTSGIYNGHQIINKNTGNVTDWIPFNATDEQIEKMQRSINFSNSDIKKSDVIKEFNSNPGAFFNDFHKMNGLLSNLNIKRDIGAPIEDEHLDKLMWYVNKYTEDTKVPTGSVLRNPGTMTNRGATDDQHLEALRMNEIFDRIKSNENSGLAEDIADEAQRRKEQMSTYEDLFGQGGTLDNVRKRSLEGMFEEGEMKLRKEAQIEKETKGYENFVKTQKAMNKSMKEAEFKAKTRSTLDDNHLEALRMNEIFDRVQKNFDSGLAEDIANERERRSAMLSTYEDLFAPGGTLDNVRRRSLERMLEDGDMKLRREAKAKKESQGFENFVKTQKAMNESMKKAELKANTRHTKLDKEQKELDAKVLKERIELGKKLDEQYAQNDAIKQAINEQRIIKGETPIELDENDPQIVKSYYDFEESGLKKATDKILKPYDGLLKDFKANVTVNNFGWHAGNFVQNKLLNAQDIGSRAFFPRTDAIDVLKGREGVYNNGSGTEMDYNLMRKYLEEGGIMNNFINKETQSSSEGNPLSKLFHNVFRASGKNSIGSGFGLLQKNQDETLAKIQNVMAHMDDGDDILTAMDKAQRTLFDYDDLKDWEKNIAKRIIPFYAYAKKNTANQLDYLMNDQRTHTKLLNAYRNIQEQIPYGEEREIKPGEENYLKGRIQIPGMTKEHKGKEFNYMLNPKLPFNPTDSADGMTNFSPFINPLIDIAKNENFFGEEIDEPVKYYLDELKNSYTHPILKTKENIERHKEKGQDFRIPPEIMKILLGISGNYY